MGPTVADVERIDLDISLDSVALGAARAALSRCPSGENQAAVVEAERSIDRLLDAQAGCSTLSGARLRQDAGRDGDPA